MVDKTNLGVYMYIWYHHMVLWGRISYLVQTYLADPKHLHVLGNTDTLLMFLSTMHYSYVLQNMHTLHYMNIDRSCGCGGTTLAVMPRGIISEATFILKPWLGVGMVVGV